jgi:hypothetical protein
MPTPTLTCACEYASGSINTLTSAKYFRYLISNPFLPSDPVVADCESRILGAVSFLFSSEALTYLNAHGEEKLRKFGWLNSTNLAKFNHLRGLAGSRLGWRSLPTRSLNRL